MDDAHYDLSAVSIPALLGRYAAILAELRDRGVVRTRNAPLGDYAEYLAAKVYNGALEPNSVKSYDLLAADGRRVQVKARTVGPDTRAGAVFSVFRSFDFNIAVLITFDSATYALRQAREVPVADLETAGRYSAHDRVAPETAPQWRLPPLRREWASGKDLVRVGLNPRFHSVVANEETLVSIKSREGHKPVQHPQTSGNNRDAVTDSVVVMRRAAVLIGVRESGDLPPLPAVLPGIRDVENWAYAQRFETVRTLTDERGKLGVRAIQDTIAELLDPGVLDQLVVYFAGHGVNIGQTEYWLLSDAPAYTNEAVNVAGSAALARRSGVQHVVFVSDACRTAADGITQQSLRGSDVFPNAGGIGCSHPVDLFYGCALGSPAYEVEDPGDSAARYKAVYTKALVDALAGKAQEVLEPGDGEPPSSLVRPRPLSEYLEGEVGRRLTTLVPSGELIQQPEAIITSPPTAWLSRLDGGHRPGGTSGPAAAEAPPTLGSVTRRAVDKAARGVDPAPILAAAASQGIAGASGLLDTVRRGGLEQLRRRPSSFRGEARFEVRGGEFAFAWSPATPFIRMLDRTRRQIRLDDYIRGTSVFLQFRNGTAVMLPALTGQLGVITLQDGTVVDIGYETLWPLDRHRDRDRDGFRSLRALVTATGSQGRFRLDRGNVDAFAARLREGRVYDPVVALHTAYAYHDLQRDDLLSDLLDGLVSTVDAGLFDVALLAGSLRTRRAPTLPVVPMLVRGWALLDALGARLPRDVTDLRRVLVPGLWTQFTANGADRVRAVLESTGGRV